MREFGFEEEKKRIKGGRREREREKEKIPTWEGK